MNEKFDCCTPGCPNRSSSKFGRYAYCASCRANRALAAPQPREAPQQNESGDSYEQRARVATRDLAAAGRKLDRAKKNAAEAAVALRDAKAEWETALRALGAATA